MKIRLATRKDTATIWKMTRELARYEKYPKFCTITKQQTAKIFFGKAASAECYMIEVEGKIVGMAKLLSVMETWTGTPFFLLRDFYVRERYRGKGYGEQFMKHAVNLARKRRYSCIQWNVFDWNTSAIGFYKKLNASVMETTRMRMDIEP